MVTLLLWQINAHSMWFQQNYQCLFVFGLLHCTSPKMVVYNLAYTTEFDPYFEHGAILAHNFTFDRQHFTI